MLAKQFEGVSVSFERRSGENDQLFGSVTSGDIAEALAKKGFDVDRRKIQIHEPLKTVGRIHCPDQASQGRDYPFESCDRERSRASGVSRVGCPLQGPSPFSGHFFLTSLVFGAIHILPAFNHLRIW